MRPSGHSPPEICKNILRQLNRAYVAAAFLPLTGRLTGVRLIKGGAYTRWYMFYWGGCPEGGCSRGRSGGDSAEGGRMSRARCVHDASLSVALSINVALIRHSDRSRSLARHQSLSFSLGCWSSSSSSSHVRWLVRLVNGHLPHLPPPLGHLPPAEFKSPSIMVTV